MEAKDTSWYVTNTNKSWYWNIKHVEILVVISIFIFTKCTKIIQQLMTMETIFEYMSNGFGTS